MSTEGVSANEAVRGPVNEAAREPSFRSTSLPASPWQSPTGT